MKTLPLRKIRTIILFITAAVILGFVSYRIGFDTGKTSAIGASTLRPLKNTTQTTEGQAIDFAEFWDVWQRIHTYWVDADSIDTQKLVWGAIQGMVGALDDPYTVFLTPKENSDFKEEIGGSFQGIGAQLGLDEGHIIIVAPLKGSPAEAAGIKPLDWILKVDGEDTVGWTVQEAVTKIRGKKATNVTLSILHEKGTAPEDITITRDDILVPSVESWVKPITEITQISGSTVSAQLKSSTDRIAYIALSRFGDRTNEEWLKAVSQIVTEEKTKPVRGLVFDLRNNPGGYLDGAVFIASEFLKNGRVVTQTNSDGTKQDYQVDRKGMLYDIPLIVLVNKGSASAAEIVAGALKDYERATIVGETSFGKGSVQSPQDLRNGASLHVTTGKWLLPKGDWIHKKGITPDYLISMDDYSATNDAQLGQAIEILMK